jgi:hypothetical protein
VIDLISKMVVLVSVHFFLSFLSLLWDTRRCQERRRHHKGLQELWTRTEANVGCITVFEGEDLVSMLTIRIMISLSAQKKYIQSWRAMKLLDFVGIEESGVKLQPLERRTASI